MAPHTFLWHDYETFGANTRRDRPAQFAAIRTDAAGIPGQYVLEIVQNSGAYLAGWFRSELGRPELKGAPDPDLDAAKGERILDRPDAADISAAAKYTERFEGGFSLGLMGARVEPARARNTGEA